MLNTIENTENPLGDLINEINSTIFSQKEWIDNEFYKIPEMTYSYEKLWKNSECIVNKTLFCDLWGLDIKQFNKSITSDKELLIEHYGDKVEEKIVNKISSIEEYLKRFNEVDSNGNPALKAKKDIIIWGLTENITFLKIAQEWLIFEKEKAILWIYFEWSNKEDSKFYIDDELRKNKLEKIEELNTKVFWEKLSNNNHNTETSLDYLFEKFEKYKSEKENGVTEQERILNTDEEVRYNNYIKKLQWLSPDYRPKIREKPKSVLDPRLKNIKVHRKYIKDIFNHGMIAHDLMSWDMNHRAYFDDSVSWFTDTAHGTAIPTTKNTEFKSSFDVTRLVWHEIEQHWIILWILREYV